MLLLWGLAWWFGGGLHELVSFYPRAELPAGLLIYASLTMLAAEAAMSRWPWQLFNRVQTALPVAGLLALVASVGVLDHPSQAGGSWAWPLLLAVTYLVLWRVEARGGRAFLQWGHVTARLVFAAMLQWELVWRLVEDAGLREGWRVAAFALVPVVLLLLVSRLGGWPLARWRVAYGVVVGGVLATAVVLWTLWSLRSPGGSGPMPWVPLLNPVDLMLFLAVGSLFHWWACLRVELDTLLGRTPEQLVWAILIALAFLWINVALLRVMHHWWGIAYQPGAVRLRAGPDVDLGAVGDDRRRPAAGRNAPRCPGNLDRRCRHTRGRRGKALPRRPVGARNRRANRLLPRRRRSPGGSRLVCTAAAKKAGARSPGPGR